ncbi:MAG: HU family DNA-binding protein [Acidobacteria bacterium]|nr:HU family DNA-binding protein [Acidobacteriota bacterium]
MDELIKRITEKTGISEDQARSAVNTVAGFLKEKLPAPLAGQVDNVLGGAGGMTDKLGDAASKIGNMFGKS